MKPNQRGKALLAKYYRANAPTTERGEPRKKFHAVQTGRGFPVRMDRKFEQMSNKNEPYSLRIGKSLDRPHQPCLRAHGDLGNSYGEAGTPFVISQTTSDSVQQLLESV